jgi:TolA-binding protein
MREKGKKILFKRFDNTTDVRRAFETVVMFAPGASFAPEALYAIVELRIKEEERSEAIEVCRMLRNRYSASPQAKSALDKEAESRMVLFRRHSYNRDRGLNTVSFLDMAIRQTDDVDMRSKFIEWRNEAYSVVEKEAYEAAKFYDSRTRKRRGAINAYEGFLKDYPASSYAPAVRERIAELKSTNGVKE